MAIEPRTTPGWKFYERHVNYFSIRDVNGLVANDYNQDAVLITFDFTVKGHKALKETFNAYLDMIGDFTLKSTDNFTETEDVVFIEATLETSKLGERKVYDVFIMKDGRISYHITGVK